jgi:hypothetical protein
MRSGAASTAASPPDAGRSGGLSATLLVQLTIFRRNKQGQRISRQASDPLWSQLPGEIGRVIGPAHFRTSEGVCTMCAPEDQEKSILRKFGTTAEPCC